MICYSLKKLQFLPITKGKRMFGALTVKQNLATEIAIVNTENLNVYSYYQ